MKAVVLGSAVHLTVLSAPFLAMGRLNVFTAPRSIACAALLVALSLLESRIAPAEPGTDARGAPALARILGALSGIGLLLIGWLAIGSGTTPGRWSWLGAGCGALGIVLRLRAIEVLGAGFSSAIEPGRRLVAEGIYAWVRHPSEAGLLLLAGGLSGLGGSWVAAGLVVAVLLPVSMLRIFQEERSLSARFGERHARYRGSVGALVPVSGRGS